MNTQMIRKLAIAGLVFALQCITNAQQGSPGDGSLEIVPRSDWQHGIQISAETHIAHSEKNREITIHNTETTPPAPDADKSAEIKALRGIQASLIDKDKERLAKGDKPWGEVAYHYFIMPSGRVYEGRNIEYQADSNTVYKHGISGHICISFVGDYRSKAEKKKKEATESPPTAKSLASLNLLIRKLKSDKAVGDDVRINTHREVAETDCPGQLLQDEVNKIRKGSPK